MKVRVRSVRKLRSVHLEAYAGRRVRLSFRRFSPSISNATVGFSFEDLNGPRGGRDKRCTVIVKAPGMPEVVVSATHEDCHAAADLAIAKASRAVTRALGRTRGFAPIPSVPGTWNLKVSP